jgi:acetyl esterase/lipase
MAECTRARRGSFQSRAAAALSKRTIRPLTAVMPIERTWGLWLSRRILAGLMDACGPSLAGTRVEYVDTTLPDGRRIVGEWVQAGGVVRGNAAIYYIHGSGYVLCSPRTHRRLTSWLSRLTGLPVFVVDYRLAPRQHLTAW